MTWFQKHKDVPPVAVKDAAVTADEVAIAYRVVLGREADAEGLRNYAALGRETGFTLADLIRTLRDSDEYRARQTAQETTTPAQPEASAPPQNLILPADVIAAHTLRDLIDTAEEYYHRIPDPTPLMAKPFAWWHETPQMLHDLGVLFSGMHLGKSMTVLDFGGGTGWLTRILTQLSCQAICCDVSASALEIGRKMFDAYPPIGTTPYRPIFLPFDGTTIDLPDESVDRIVCFDAFHHVPNADRVVAEMGRVLKTGGIAGFSEPGRWHSRSPQSQYEMRHHKVLENDIDLNAIAVMARAAGFTSVTVKALIDRDLSLADYNTLLDDTPLAREPLRADLWNDVRRTLANRSVFFLHKGTRLRDSRSHVGLAHRLDLLDAPVTAEAGRPFTIAMTATNTGEAVWLHEHTEIFGVVRLGSHLYDHEGTLLSLDYSRHELPAQVRPGETVTVRALMRIAEPGQYRLQFDLVAEGVTWFENVGANTVQVTLTVT